MADWLRFSCIPRGNSRATVSPTPSHRVADAPLKSKMAWAGTFIDLVPIPVCLIDGKGFVHYTNSDFNSLVSIQHNADLCPFAGRYMLSSAEFREVVESVANSPTVSVVHVVIVWKDSAVVCAKANKSFVWTVSGSSTSAAVVLSGRNLDNVTHIDNRSYDDASKRMVEESNIEKHRVAREHRQVRLHPSAEEIKCDQKWEKFYERCGDKSKVRPSDMSGFVDVIKAAAATAT